MSKYDKDTMFHWLVLKEDFFEDDAISWLEEQQPNGKDYAYFYLKLCLKSLKTNGILIRKVGEFLIPYNNEKLAEITKVDFDTVTVAMELLKKIGLIKILENGEIYLQQLENLIGSKSLGAFKKQQQRSLENKGQNHIGGQMSANCPPKIEIEIEREIEIELEIEEKKINKKKKFGEFQNVLLTDEEFEKLKNRFDDYETKINKLSFYIESKGAKYKSHYATILNWSNNSSNNLQKSQIKSNNPFIAMVKEEL